MRCLQPQLANHDDVELLTNIDSGEMCIGAKRNELLLKASGDYVACVDDDDLVADDYVSQVLAAIETAPDVIGFTLLVTTHSCTVGRS